MNDSWNQFVNGTSNPHFVQTGGLHRSEGHVVILDVPELNKASRRRPSKITLRSV